MKKCRLRGNTALKVGILAASAFMAFNLLVEKPIIVQKKEESRSIPLKKYTDLGPPPKISLAQDELPEPLIDSIKGTESGPCPICEERFRNSDIEREIWKAFRGADSIYVDCERITEIDQIRNPYFFQNDRLITREDYLDAIKENNLRKHADITKKSARKYFGIPYLGTSEILEKGFSVRYSPIFIKEIRDLEDSSKFVIKFRRDIEDTICVGSDLFLGKTLSELAGIEHFGKNRFVPSGNTYYDGGFIIPENSLKILYARSDNYGNYGFSLVPVFDGKNPSNTGQINRIADYRHAMIPGLAYLVGNWVNVFIQIEDWQFNEKYCVFRFNLKDYVGKDIDAKIDTIRMKFAPMNAIVWKEDMGEYLYGLRTYAYLEVEYNGQYHNFLFWPKVETARIHHFKSDKPLLDLLVNMAKICPDK